MKVLQLGKFYPIQGGVEKVMYDLTCGLSHEKVFCDMLCATLYGKGFDKKINNYSRLLCIHSLCKVSGTMIAPAMLRCLKKRCNEYDIIHVHHPDPMAALSLLFSGYKGHVVLHWHSDIVKQHRLLKLYMPLQNWLIKRADLIIGTSPVYLKGSPFLKRVQEKTTCLPIGIEDMSRNSARATELHAIYKHRKIIFSLGRLVHYKGFRYLVQAAQYLDDDYVVVIGGCGPLEDELKNQIKELSLEKKVFLIGRVSDDDVVAYYEACQVFCLPSVMKTEAFGIVQIEAMSFGKPIVTTAIPDSGVGWVNVNGKSGINVAPCDAKALAASIQYICADEKRYKHFSEGALRNYRERFTQDMMIDNCLTLYRKLKTDKKQ